LCHQCLNVLEYSNTESDFLSRRNDWKLYEYQDYDGKVEFYCCLDHMDDFDELYDGEPEQIRTDLLKYPPNVKQQILNLGENYDLNEVNNYFEDPVGELRSPNQRQEIGHFWV
jgi:hypothetical protein